MQQNKRYMARIDENNDWQVAGGMSSQEASPDARPRYLSRVGSHLSTQSAIMPGDDPYLARGHGNAPSSFAGKIASRMHGDSFGSPDGITRAMSEFYAASGDDMTSPGASHRPGADARLRRTISGLRPRMRSNLQTEGMENTRAFFELAAVQRDNEISESLIRQVKRHESRALFEQRKLSQEIEKTRQSIEAQQRALWAAVLVQARWRGLVARRRVERMRLERHMEQLVERHESSLASQWVEIAKQVRIWARLLPAASAALRTPPQL